MAFRTHLCRCLRQASLDLRVRGVTSWVLWIAVAVVLIGTVADVGAVGTPAGTLISARATVSYIGPNGTPGSATSPDALVMMGQVAGVDVEPPRSSLAPAGTSVVFSHSLTNVGNGPDSFVLTATSLDGWPIRMVLDVNGDGTEDAGDTPIVGPVALIADASAQVLVVLDIPAGTPIAASRPVATLTATSQFDAGVTDAITDNLEIIPPTPILVLSKAVDAASAIAGDVLTYTITYQAQWLGPNDLIIRDTIPAGLSYEAATLRLGTSALTDASGDDEGQHDPTANEIVVTVPFAQIQPQDSVSFQVRVLPRLTTTMMQNVAVASAGATTAASNVSETLIAGPDLLLEKTVQGPNPARSGDELVYRIRLTNDASGGLAQDAVVTDTVPVGLEVVDAGAGATVDGNVVTWALGDLNPTDQVETVLRVRVTETIPDSLTVVNVARLSLVGVPHMTASAPSVLLLGTDGGVLGLEFQAQTLEVQLGQPVYVSYVVENRSDVNIDDVGVTIDLPSGLVWSGSLEQLDSIQTQPGQVTLYLGSLAPGATLEGRASLALVSALPGNMVITARAFGHVEIAALSPPAPLIAALTSGTVPTGATAALHGGSAIDFDVRSALQQVFVGVRGGTPLETRTVIGKIWIDEDGNGRQDGGERGVHGVSVWTEAGDVATSDTEGKLSFRNVRPGAHSFRVDRSSLPVALRVNPDGDSGFASLHLNGWASGRISFGLIPRGARLVDLQIRNEDEAADDQLPVVRLANYQVGAKDAITEAELATLAGPVAPGSLIQSDLVLEPHRAGWPEVVYPVPAGWRPLPGAVRLGDTPVADPEIRVDRDGSPWMFWTLNGSREALHVTLEPEGAVRAPDPVSLPALRSAEERARDGGSGITNGPGVKLIAPVDGAVLGSDRVYVGALGEPGARVALFSGDSLLVENVMRVDGQVDFIGVGLQRGTNRLRIRMINSWNQERWDSLDVHVTSIPASFAPQADTVSLPADGVSIRETRVRVLDAWGIPVVNGPFVTVSAGLAEVVDRDADPSSVGRQLLAGPDGWLTIRIRAASEVSLDVLALQAGEATGEVALQHIPKARDLMVTSMGQFGLGAAPEDFGAITVRGRLGAETGVTLTYDSRTLDPGRDAYGRTISPLDEAQYPILGDASVRRSEANMRPGISARIERGTDWIAAGEVANMGFGTSLTLAQYRRALPGVAANVRTGPVTWSGFGAITSQSLRQIQIRGEGVSGPYDVGPGMVPGTERVSVETRDKDNPERSLRLQTLERLVDYQIDYVTGTLLLKSPVPAADLNNNPVFIVVNFEADSGGESTSVWGLRAQTDFGIPLGLSVVQDRAQGESFEMLGADVRIRALNGSELAAEVAYTENPDSAGLAVLISGQGNLLSGAVALTGQWMHVADGFVNPASVGILAVDEIEVGAQVKVAGSELRVGHGRQSFTASGIERRTTDARVVTAPVRSLSLTAGFTDQAVENGNVPGGASRAGRLELAWQPTSRLRLWTEAQNSFLQDPGAGLGDFVGGGASLALLNQFSLEARHLRVQDELAGDYSVTRFGLESRLEQGTRAWGSYEIAGGVDHQTNAAVVGLNQRVRLGESWTINGLLERRLGLERAALSDPLRAAPFTQREEDFWSAGLSIELLPEAGPYSASAQLERRKGAVRSSRMANLAADITFNRSLAILTRGTYNTVSDADTGLPTQRAVSGLFALALRPAGSDALNALLKLEWRQDENRPQQNVFGALGQESRLIGAAELIWSPLARVELGGRYAVRGTRFAIGAQAPLRSLAHYVGSRLNLGLTSWLGVGGEGRLLAEGTSGEMRWDAAPVLTLTPLNEFEIAGGYRFGDLLDPDFAANGGQGWFVTLQLRVTENNPIVDYWRNRMRSTMARRGDTP